MNCTILILTPKLREAMSRAGKLVSLELPDLALVEIPIEMQGIMQRVLDFDRSLDQFWSGYERATGLAAPFVRAARYSWDHFLLELRKAKLVKPELKVACYRSVQDEKDRTRLSEKLLALELRSKISRIDVKEWRGYLAEELLGSQSSFKSAYDRLIGRLRGGLRKAVLWCGSASPIVNVLRKNGCPFQVRYVVTYLKPPLTMLLAVARIRGLDNITDREIETGVKMHLQYLDGRPLHLEYNHRILDGHGKDDHGTALLRNGLHRGGNHYGLFEAVKARHSIRAFQRRPIEEEKMNRIIETVNLAPSAGDLQAYEIVVVKDSRRKNEL